MFSSLTKLVLLATLYHVLNQVTSAGLVSSDVRTDNLSASASNHKYELLAEITNKMDGFVQTLQEKMHTWDIFQHHIESWNEGIRIVENKLDHLRRKYEEQQQQLDKLAITIGEQLEKDTSVRQEIRNSLKAEQDLQMMSSSKLNSILRHIQAMQTENTSSVPKKHANVMTPVKNNNNVLNKIDQRLNSIVQQMAQQKDLKQLHSLTKRNSNGLERLDQVLGNALDKQEEFVVRLQRSSECCYALSNELTTFTESSDILLKRIEKLVRNVSERLHQIEHLHKYHDEEELMREEEEKAEEIDNVDVSTVQADSDCSGEQSETEDTHIEDHDADADINMVTGAEEYFKSDSSVSKQNEHEHLSDNIFADGEQEIEFISPNLKGCHELHTDTSAEEQIDGIYKFQTPQINEKERDFNERYCVFPKGNESHGLPWTVIQQRGPYRQQENFNRSWADYRNGFGYLYRDFWFGNEYIHRLVYPEDYELRIELEDFNGTKVWAEYDTFRIDSEQFNYNLLISGYRGNVADGLKYHNDKDFSTYDRRNDRTVDACCPCAMSYASGWWFDNCAESNLNGIYHDTPLGHNYIGVVWELWHGDYSLKASRMLIRPHKVSTNSTKYPSSEEIHEDP